jgi:hypothetical protein
VNLIALRLPFRRALQEDTGGRHRHFKEISKMNKLIVLAIGLGLALGTVSFAQTEAPKTEKKAKKSKKSKKADKADDASKKM